MRDLIRDILATALAILPATAVAQPSPAVLGTAGPAVVRIVAGGCAGGPSGGTGFAWGAPGRVVTALHVVAACDDLRVNYQGVGERTARVERVLRSADLALLSVADPPPLTPLQVSTRVPIGETVAVFGYALGMATREERRLYVTAANTDTPLLGDAVNAEAREQLRALGAPALSTEVLRVDGNLLPGHSGAPVLDVSGQVVGIGSGGLQRGTVGVGWAVRARYLADLVASPLVPNGRAAALGSASDTPGYATVASGTGGSRSRCGELDFVRTRTGLTLGALIASSDDRLGFQQIAMTTGRPWETLSAISFDVWTEARSGAGIAVPAGGVLHPSAGSCIARWANGVVSLVVAGSALPDPDDPGWPVAVQSATSAFSFSWGREFLPYLQINPNFSYGPPRTGSGGLLVNRMTFFGQRPGGSVPYAAFQTLLAKGKASVNVAAITRHYPFPMTPLPDENTYRAWIAVVFAAHLSTVPP